MPQREAKWLQQTGMPLQNQFYVEEEVWILKFHQFKLQNEKLGLTVVVVMHHSNNHTEKGFDKTHFNKTNDLHYKRFWLCKPFKLQRNSQIIASAKKAWKVWGPGHQSVDLQWSNHWFLL